MAAPAAPDTPGTPGTPGTPRGSPNAPGVKAMKAMTAMPVGQGSNPKKPSMKKPSTTMKKAPMKKPSSTVMKKPSMKKPASQGQASKSRLDSSLRRMGANDDLAVADSDESDVEMTLADRVAYRLDKIEGEWVDMAMHNRSFKVPPAVNYHIFLNDEMTKRKWLYTPSGWKKCPADMSMEAFKVAVVQRPSYESSNEGE